MISKIFDMIQLFLSGQYNGHAFSLDLEDALHDYYNAMEEENAEVNHFLQEELPDICASYDEGAEVEFMAAIKNQYEAALKMYTE